MEVQEFLSEMEGALRGDRLIQGIEAVLFLAGGPVSRNELKGFFKLDEPGLDRALLQLKLNLLHGNSPLMLREVEDALYLSLKLEFQHLAERFYRDEKNRTLSPQAYETLAAIAYQQPATRAQIEAVRGCNSDSLISRLVSDGLIEEAGKLDLPGRPQTFRVSERFLQELGFDSVAELPSIDLSMFDSLQELEQ